jgi:hypothetical protein
MSAEVVHFAERRREFVTKSLIFQGFALHVKIF